MATILDSATLERLFWLHCGEWIIVKPRVEGTQDRRYYNSSEGKKNPWENKGLELEIWIP